MKSIPSIRELFLPIQPMPFHKGVRYEEQHPDFRLSPYIYCYWTLQSKSEIATSYQYRIVPDGCIDIYVDLHRQGLSFITGFANEPATFELGTNFHYAGIRFLPGAFPLLFKLDASELANRSEDLSLIVNHLAKQLLLEFEQWKVTTPLSKMLDQYFLKIVASRDIKPDFRFINALMLILQNAGELSLDKNIDTGVSPRQLRRLFNFYVGDSPKVFERIVRFQRVLRHHHTYGNFELSYQHYHDQAHFIREFKLLYGTTPTRVGVK